MGAYRMAGKDFIISSDLTIILRVSIITPTLLYM